MWGNPVGEGAILVLTFEFCILSFELGTVALYLKFSLYSRYADIESGYCLHQKIPQIHRFNFGGYFIHYYYCEGSFCPQGDNFPHSSASANGFFREASENCLSPERNRKKTQILS